MGNDHIILDLYQWNKLESGEIPAAILREQQASVGTTQIIKRVSEIKITPSTPHKSRNLPGSVSIEIVNEVNHENTNAKQFFEQVKPNASINTTVYREVTQNKTDSSTSSSNQPLNETNSAHLVEPINTPVEPEINTDQLGALFARLQTSQITSKIQSVPVIKIIPSSPIKEDQTSILVEEKDNLENEDLESQNITEECPINTAIPEALPGIVKPKTTNPEQSQCLNSLENNTNIRPDEKESEHLDSCVSYSHLDDSESEDVGRVTAKGRTATEEQREIHSQSQTEVQIDLPFPTSIITQIQTSPE